MSRKGAKDCKLEPGGIEAGKAPALAGGVERIGRRADAEMARDRDLLVPGIEAVGLHADRDVEIEPDLHAELAAPDRRRRRAAGRRSIARIRRTRFRRRPVPAARLRIWHRPAAAIPPAIPTTACRICAAAPRSRQSATATGRARRGIDRNPAGALGFALALKAAKAERSARHFRPADGDVIDDVARPQRRQRIAGRRHRAEIREAFRRRYRAR